MTAPLRTYLTLEAARAAADAAMAAAVSKRLEMTVCVVDQGGNLLVLLRSSKASFHSRHVAEDKAYTAASFGFPTSQWREMLAKDATLAARIAQVPRLSVFGGGLPITRDGWIIGAVGVSGGSEAEDEACASAGLESLGA